MIQKGALSDKNVILKLFVWLGLILLLTLPMEIIWIAVVGVNASVSSLKILQVIQTFVVFILPALAAVWLWSERPMAWLHLDKGMSWQTALLVPLMMVMFVPGINLLSVLNQQVELPAAFADLEMRLKELEEGMTQLTEQFAYAENVPQLLLNLIIMAALPAIGEEICFRGTCQGLFTDGTSGPYNYTHLRARTHVAIWVTAFLFSAIHFQFYGFVPRMLLGALLGYLLCYSGSLYVPMLAHFTNNTVAVLGLYMVGKGVWNEEAVDAFGSGDTLWVGILSLIAGSALLWLFVRRQSSAPRL